MSDELLVVRCQVGERKAFTELVQGWHPRVERYVGRMLGGPDDDVVQEIWLAVVKGPPRLRRPDRFAPWFFTVARRAVMNRLREAYTRPEPEPIAGWLGVGAWLAFTVGALIITILRHELERSDSGQ
jgi:RNA polymerase sigma-70 factor (ECF subfamily)